MISHYSTNIGTLQQSIQHETKKSQVISVLIDSLPSALNITLPAFAAERRRLRHGALSAPAAIDRYLLPAGRSAANPPPAAAAAERRDRQADGRTDASPLHRPFSAYYAASVNNCN